MFALFALGRWSVRACNIRYIIKLRKSKLKFGLQIEDIKIFISETDMNSL